jgi:hypothetical protein
VYVVKIADYKFLHYATSSFSCILGRRIPKEKAVNKTEKVGVSVPREDAT